MRNFQSPKIDLGDIQLDDAANIVYGEDLMKIMHGEDVQIEPWKNNRRRLRITMDADSVIPLPEEIRKFVCGSRVKSTVKQRIVANTANLHSVKSNVKLHVLGSEFLRIRSIFNLSRCKETNKTLLNSEVEVHAIFPPPLNKMLEGFMIHHAEHDIAFYEDRIVAAVKT